MANGNPWNGKDGSKSLAEMLVEAITTAQCNGLNPGEVEAYAHTFAAECFSHLKDSIMVALESCGHIPASVKSETAAGDAANLVIAGLAGERSLLCACNHAWLASDRATFTTPDGVCHGYDDCD